MTGSRDESGKVRVALFAMRCAFSGPVLDALSAAPDVDLAAVVLPSRTPESDPIRACDAALIDIPDRASLAGPAFRATLEELAPDVIVVACFPWRLPAWMLALSPRGCLNLHPSLLPHARGPEPVFWAFRRDLAETGVTLHLMNEAFDAGPVIAQERVTLPAGATIPSLELSLARIGARLLVDHLQTPLHRVAPPMPQREEDAWYAPVPRDADRLVTTSWDARHAARFIHAVVPVYGPVPVIVLATGQRLAVDAIMRVDDHVDDLRPVTLAGDMARIRFNDGMLACRIQRGDRPLHLHT